MPPVVIAAGIGAAAGIGGAVLGGSAQKKAAGKAADAAENTAAMNNALQEKIYNSNVGYLSPYASIGHAPSQAINSLLGLGSAPAPVTGAVPVVGGPPAAPVVPAAPLVRPERPTIEEMRGLPSAQRRDMRADYRGDLAAFRAQPAPSSTPMSGAPGASATGLSNNPAFNQYLNSTGYQFQIDQGNKAINQGYAAKGALQSGAALKALQTYGQNTATSFFKDYLGLLANQQAVGLSGASAIAGVGQGYANNVGANNNAAGSAQANAYLAQGNATAGMYGNIAGAIGGLAATPGLFGSSYRP